MRTRSERDSRLRYRWPAGVLDAVLISTLVPGLLCLAVYTFAKADQHIASAAAVNAFQEARDHALSRLPDQTLWSENRRAAYDEALLADAGIPIALLHIPSLDLLVPILDGTNDVALNRGIGWIDGTAPPGGNGNVGLAGHRDGFFRGLKDLKVGDALEIQTIDTSRQYRVTRVSIVEPTDVRVLDPTDDASVTLVTCYPFYFVGDAPQRYIVRGVIDEPSTHVRSRLVSTADSVNDQKQE